MLDLHFLFSLTQDSTTGSRDVKYSDTEGGAVVFSPPEEEKRLFNADGLTVTSSAKKMTGIIVEIN